jgi:hypothetical protein
VRDSRPEPQIKFLPFQSLDFRDALGLATPPFSHPNVHRQLSYVQEYAEELGCRTVAIEWPYIDRDHIEDHSVFYSKSLYPHRNWCQRVHFFSLDVVDLQAQLDLVVQQGAREGREAYDNACKHLSEKSYLGFCVVKPLDGTPVGRTVLRPYDGVPREPERAKVFRRIFGCSSREYRAHVLGVDLRVRGLAFQQQDVGVSACATTAIWCALQAFGKHEELAPATPAQITNLAARFSLPFGRAMPSEGLSLDQMCQAIQALGVSPNVFRVEDDIETARGILASAINSEFSPILILKHGDTRRGHAVAVAGMKVRVARTGEIVSPRATSSAEAKPPKLRDLAGDLLGLYIHDDRRGPYLRADLLPSDNKPSLSIDTRGGGQEVWAMTHILLPMHNKVRLSFANLRDVAIAAAWRVYQDGQKINLVLGGRIKDTSITFETMIVRGHKYIEQSFMDRGSPDRALRLCRTIPMARYLGVVRLTSSFFDPLDLLVDTTSTLRNLYCLGVVLLDTKNPLTPRIANSLAKHCSCPVVL